MRQGYEIIMLASLAEEGDKRSPVEAITSVGEKAFLVS